MPFTAAPKPTRTGKTTDPELVELVKNSGGGVQGPLAEIPGVKTEGKGSLFDRASREIRSAAAVSGLSVRIRRPESDQEIWFEAYVAESASE